MKFIDVLRRPFPYRRFNITLALIIVNVGVFLISLFSTPIYFSLSLYPRAVFELGYVWQVFTYMFVHSIGNYGHIFFNMIGLYMFGMTLEDRLGSIEFLLYYLFCGIGAGIAILFLSDPSIPTVGASGAIFGLLLAFAAMFPDARILLFFFIPMKAPMAVLVFAGISLVFLFTGTGGGISHLGHLAGIVFGFLYLVVRLNINPIRVFFGRNRSRY